MKQSLAWVNLPRSEKDTVLLTFDDGPHPEHTVTVLQLLRRYNARAIFFVVGSRLERAPSLLKRIRDDGHLIGNHGHAHPLGRQPPFISYLRDLRLCQSEIERLTGEKPKFFRPPLGVFSPTTMIAPRFLELHPMLWSINSFDFGPENRGFKSLAEAEKSAEALTLNLSAISKLHEILLMHDEHPYIETMLVPTLEMLSRRKCDLQGGAGFVLASQRSSNLTKWAGLK